MRLSTTSLFSALLASGALARGIPSIRERTMASPQECMQSIQTAGQSFDTMIKNLSQDSADTAKAWPQYVQGMESAMQVAASTLQSAQPMAEADAQAFLTSVEQLSSSMKMMCMSMVLQQPTLDTLGLVPKAVEALGRQKKMLHGLGQTCLTKVAPAVAPTFQHGFGQAISAMDYSLATLEGHGSIVVEVGAGGYQMPAHGVGNIEEQCTAIGFGPIHAIQNMKGLGQEHIDALGKHCGAVGYVQMEQCPTPAPQQQHCPPQPECPAPPEPQQCPPQQECPAPQQCPAQKECPACPAQECPPPPEVKEPECPPQQECPAPQECPPPPEMKQPECPPQEAPQCPPQPEPQPQECPQPDVQQFCTQHLDQLCGGQGGNKPVNPDAGQGQDQGLEEQCIAAGLVQGGGEQAPNEQDNIAQCNAIGWVEQDQGQENAMPNDKPQDAMPDKPQGTMPNDKPQDSMPNKPQDAMPNEKPQDGMPNNPQDDMPDKPQGAMANDKSQDAMANEDKMSKSKGMFRRTMPVQQPAAGGQDQLLQQCATIGYVQAGQAQGQFRACPEECANLGLVEDGGKQGSGNDDVAQQCAAHGLQPGDGAGAGSEKPQGGEQVPEQQMPEQQMPEQKMGGKKMDKKQKATRRTDTQGQEQAGNQPQNESGMSLQECLDLGWVQAADSAAANQTEVAQGNDAAQNAPEGGAGDGSTEGATGGAAEGKENMKRRRAFRFF